MGPTCQPVFLFSVVSLFLLSILPLSSLCFFSLSLSPETTPSPDLLAASGSPAHRRGGAPCSRARGERTSHGSGGLLTWWCGVAQSTTAEASREAIVGAGDVSVTHASASPSVGSDSVSTSTTCSRTGTKPQWSGNVEAHGMLGDRDPRRMMGRWSGSGTPSACSRRATCGARGATPRRGGELDGQKWPFSFLIITAPLGLPISAS